LVGATGSGKSTALQLVAALAQPSAGRAVVLGRDTSDPSVELRSLRMAAPLSIQRPESAIFEPYAGDEVAFGPRNRGLSGAALVDAVRRAMDAVGLAYDEFRDRPSRALSGGQKRRLALASVLAMTPEILVLDEPGSALDPVSRAELMALLLSAEEGGRSVVFSTHAMEEAARADAVAVMSRGRLAAYSSPEEIFGEGWDDSWGLKRPFAAELAAELSRAYEAQGFDAASLAALRAAVTPAALVAALAAPSAGTPTPSASTPAPSASTPAEEGGAS
jgi:energy-coupling factor transport system ATP-binding protein